jgi:hypothetical protein
MDMKKYISVMLITQLLLIAGVAGIAQKKEVNGYQIENKKSGLLLRPYEADGAEGVPIVVYPKYAWQCLTWDLTTYGANMYSLRNYFTGKTFQVSGKSKDGAGIEQVSINDSLPEQKWEFVKMDNGYYRIQVPGTDKVLTVDGEGANEKVKLMKWKKADGQMWKLLPKPEKFTG